MEEKLEELLKIIPEHERIMPEAIAEKLKINLCQASNLCMKLVERGLLDMRFEVVCPKCSSATAFKSVMEIPDEIRCKCGNVFIPLRENIRIFFERV